MKHRSHSLNGDCPPTLPTETDRPATALTAITTTDFQEWRRASNARENVEKGHAYYNDPSPVPPPEKHTPSSLIQCHRKLVYRKENAPAETEMAHGILWVGTRFEEDVVLPYLRDAVDDDGLLVTNSLYVDFEVESDAGDLVVKGSTDPVVVDGDGIPVLPTEVKTKGSIECLDEPNEHHKAQLHAYMVGLSEKYDIDVKQGCLIYGERDSFDLKVFDIKFDDTFWEDVVVDWASEHTEYRLDDKLPPANSQFGWECDFCAYRERCGKGDEPVADRSFEGFLPNVTYPRPLVIEHLDSHPDVMLTPTLAAAYPDLTEEHDVAKWRCTTCAERFDHHDIDWDKDSSGTPLCPSCVREDTLSELTVAWPSEHESVSTGDESA